MDRAAAHVDAQLARGGRVSTRADPIATQSIGESVPESTRPTALPPAPPTGVSGRMIRRSPVLKNTTFRGEPPAFSAASAARPRSRPACQT